MGLACKDLPIKVFHPAPDDLFFGQIEGVLQVEQASDEARP
jgi:hypothetical protein